MKKEGTMERKYITIAKCKPWTWVMVPIKMYSINNIKDMRRHENHLIQRYKPQLNFIGTYKQNNKRDVYKKLKNKKLRNKRLRKNKIKILNESETTFTYKQHGKRQTVNLATIIFNKPDHERCHVWITKGTYSITNWRKISNIYHDIMTVKGQRIKQLIKGLPPGIPVKFQLQPRYRKEKNIPPLTDVLEKNFKTLFKLKLADLCNYFKMCNIIKGKDRKKCKRTLAKVIHDRIGINILRRNKSIPIPTLSGKDKDYVIDIIRKNINNAMKKRTTITDNKKRKKKRIPLFIPAFIRNKFQPKFRDGTNPTILDILGNQREFSKKYIQNFPPE